MDWKFIRQKQFIDFFHTAVKLHNSVIPVCVYMCACLSVRETEKQYVFVCLSVCMFECPCLHSNGKTKTALSNRPLLESFLNQHPPWLTAGLYLLSVSQPPPPAKGPAICRDAPLDALQNSGQICSQ